MQVRAHGEDVVVHRGKNRENAQGNVLPDYEGAAAANTGPLLFAGLPPFTAGAVGYFAYDTRAPTGKNRRAGERRSLVCPIAC